MVLFKLSIITEEDLLKESQENMLSEFLLLAIDSKTPASELFEKRQAILVSGIDDDTISDCYESAIKFREKNLTFH